MDLRPAIPNSAESNRADELFDERFDANVRRTDRVFAYLMIGQWLFGLALAIFISPYAWAGKTHVIHEHVYVAIFLGGTISALPVLLGFFRPGWWLTRVVIAVAQMLWSGLLIHLSGGRIETHFHVFGSLAFLAFYRDWRVVLLATFVVVADHGVRQALWPESVFGILTPESWRFLEHGGWVVFEDVFLILSCISSVREMKNIAEQQAHIEITNRLEREMEIAARIQTSILPRNLEIGGLEVAAKMITASEVGGDYYEVLPVKDGCWIGIGDVAGHGLPAGLVMLQAQSAIAALVKRHPDGTPREVLEDVNRVLYENVRKRLASNEHVTMSLIRYYDDGRIVFAGAHEEALIWRAATRSWQRLPVKGTWLAAVKEIGAATVDARERLEKGDLLVLYTDGVTEGRGAAGVQFGLDRLCEAVEGIVDASAAEIRDEVLRVLAKWTGGRQDDDITIMIFRHLGIAQEAAA